MSKGPGDPGVTGEKVDCMNILEQGDDGQSLKLGCAKCGRTFWFDDIPTGRNAVVRDSTDPEKGTEIHAKCPKCGCEWDGELRHYYVVGFLFGPPPDIKALASLLSGDDAALANHFAILVFDAVQAADTREAYTKVTFPKTATHAEARNGFVLMACSKDDYERYRTKNQDTETFDRTVNPPHSDPNAAAVMEAMGASDN